jgi:hypothetical protein
MLRTLPSGVSIFPKSMRPTNILVLMEQADISDHHICEHRYGSLAHNNLSISHIGFIWYDYMLTFGREVDLFWRAKKRSRLSTFFYIALRYPLIANLLYLLAVTNKLPKVSTILDSIDTF